MFVVVLILEDTFENTFNFFHKSSILNFKIEKIVKLVFFITLCFINHSVIGRLVRRRFKLGNRVWFWCNFCGLSFPTTFFEDRINANGQYCQHSDGVDG